MLIVFLSFVFVSAQQINIFYLNKNPFTILNLQMSIVKKHC